MNNRASLPRQAARGKKVQFLEEKKGEQLKGVEAQQLTIQAKNRGLEICAVYLLQFIKRRLKTLTMNN